MRKKVQESLFILLCTVLAICFGCAYVPSTKVDAIYKKNGTLFVATSDGAVKTFDAQTHALKGRFEFPNMKYGRQYYSPRVTRIFGEDNRVVIQVHQGNQNKIFILNDAALQEIASFESPMILIVAGKDDNYYYINMTSGSKAVKGFRLDKSFKNKIDGHFDNLKELTLVDSVEDYNHYWYLCINKNEIEFNVRRTPEALVQLTLVAKMKNSSDFKSVELGQITMDKPFFVDGGRSIWIFSGRQLFSVSKENLTYKIIPMSLRLIPVSDNASDSSAFIWAMNDEFGSEQSLIYRINKNTDEIIPTPVQFDRTIRIPTFPFERRFYSDRDYLWLYSEILKRPGAPSGNFSPYLLQISKASLTSESLLIKPTVREAISTVTYNFFAILTSPFWAHKQ